VLLLLLLCLLGLVRGLGLCHSSCLLGIATLLVCHLLLLLLLQLLLHVWR
jgi:hypothetical protein